MILYGMVNEGVTEEVKFQQKREGPGSRDPRKCRSPAWNAVVCSENSRGTVRLDQWELLALGTWVGAVESDDRWIIEDCSITDTIHPALIYSQDCCFTRCYVSKMGSIGHLVISPKTWKHCWLTFSICYGLHMTESSKIIFGESKKYI